MKKNLPMKKCVLPMEVADFIFEELCKKELRILREKLEDDAATITETLNKTVFEVSVKVSGLYSNNHHQCANFRALLEYSYRFVLGFDE